MNYTEELGLKLPELDDSFDLEGHWNYNTEKLDAFAATTNTAVGTLESGLSAAQSQIAALQGGVHLKGSVNYYADLPEDPGDGDAYTVLYFGTTGQEPAGIEYAWVESSQSWIPIGVDPAAFAKPADITAAIAALDVTETGGAGQYISAIKEINGKIEATPTTFDTSLSSSSTNNNAPTSKAVYDDQERQETEIGAVANRGAKNSAKTTTVSFTTSTQIELSPITGIVVFSARNIASDDTSASQCAAVFNYSDGTSSEKILINRGENVSSEKELGKTATMVTIYASDTAAHSTGKTATFTDIMVRPASITDSTFQPYALPNPTLTPAAIKAVDNGAKNRIIFDGVGTGASNVGTSYTSNGITFEVQSDGTIRATGTISSGYSYCYLYAGTGRINIIDAFDGKHVLSGNPQGASESTYRLWYRVVSQTAVSVGDSSVILPEVTGETNAVLGIMVDAPKTNLDIIFKPMICTAADWAVSQKFVPYCPTNRELYEMIQALQNNS